MNSKKLALLFILVCVACNNLSYKNFYNEGIEVYRNVIDDKRILIIIPGTGCNGCIIGIEDFVINNLNNCNNIVLVFTNIKSEKLIKLKFKDLFQNYSENIIIDKENIFYNIENKNKIYPTILYLNKLKIINVEYISPAQELSIEQLLNISQNNE